MIGATLKAHRPVALTLDEMDHWAARAAAYIDGLTATAHAGTGLPRDVVRATITCGKDDFSAARKLLLKEKRHD
jgi:hypothetical protein